MRVHGGTSKAGEAQLDYKFEPKQWYHVVLTHSTGSALAPSWIRLFANGSLEASERLKYPKVRQCLEPCQTWRKPHF